mmetsp:Transcript_30019/g.34385  ORF Transcript_30019/g.34385 Transcript_30019/m.34385 type:complete len:142 (-) Transcript_30019:45-470(-)
MKNRNGIGRGESYDVRESRMRKSASGFGLQDEFRTKYQLNENEIEELKNSLHYVETKLGNEINVREDLMQKAEMDKIELIKCQRKLKEQEEVNKNQTKQITRLSEQLDDFTNSQGNIVKQLKEKFDDYNREMREKEEKLFQ